MAAATSIARYLLDEASSGSTPTTCADEEGGHDLAIDYSAGDAEWASIAAGNGLDFTSYTGGAVAEIADMSAAGSIGGQLDGATEASAIVVAKIDNSTGNQHRVIALGTSSGNGELAMTFGTTTIELRWGNESGGGRTVFPWTLDSTAHVFHLVFDSTEGTQSDRARLWVDGSEQTATSGTIPSGESISTQSSGISFTIGNRPSANREIDGALYYVELFTGKLSGTEISDSNTALAADNDADWAGSGGTLSPAGVGAAGAIGAPSASGSGSVALGAAGVGAAGGIGAPTLSPSGIAAVSPSGLGAAGGVGSPAVSPSGAAAVSPSSVATLGAIGSPSLSGSGSASLSPSGVGAAGAIGAPTVSATGSTLSPTGVGAAGGIGSPSLSGSGSAALSAASVGAAGAIGAPTASGSGSVALSPASVAGAGSIGAPVIDPSGAAALSPTGVGAVGAIGTPSATGGSPALSPTGVGAAGGIGSPLLSGSGSAALSAASVGAAGAIGAPTLSDPTATAAYTPSPRAPAYYLAPAARPAYYLHPAARPAVYLGG